MTPTERAHALKFVHPTYLSNVPVCSVQCPYYIKAPYEACEYWAEHAPPAAPDFCWFCSVCLPAVDAGLTPDEVRRNALEYERRQR